MFRRVAVLCLLLALDGCSLDAAASPAPSAAPAIFVGSVDAPGPTPGPTPASPAAADIDRLRAHLAADPLDAAAWRDLGFALSQRVRETADPSLYAAAQDAFDRALALTPSDPLLLAGIGGLQLGRHEFAAALETGRRAIALDPTLAPAHAVIVDALVELGRYDEAEAAVTDLLALGVDLASLARFSYLRELQGDLVRAEAAMAGARSLPALSPENVAYVTGLHANLVAWLGHPDEARAEYEEALSVVPDHAPSIAGLARLDLRVGDVTAAVEGFRRAADILPLPEYVIALGESQELAGDTEAARDSYDLARVEIQLFEAAGVAVDLALFEASHGDPDRALALATTAYASTPTVRAADALAWALHQLGRDAEARQRSDEALRLGSVDPLFRYHSGMIWAALRNADAARSDLSAALATDSGFSATGAREARETLASLGR
jgi:tetratricopeptide (TPR) repeat protein